MQKLADKQAVRGAVLFVCNYKTNTGYAWDFIEGLYANMARRLERHGLLSFVAYPTIDEPPRTLAGSPATAVALDASLQDMASVNATVAFVRRHNVRLIYLTDRPLRSWRHAVLQALTGVRLIVHDHTSGTHVTAVGLRKAAKWLLSRVPLMVANRVITVSDFVRERDIRSVVLPEDRIVRVWNGIPLPEMHTVAQKAIFEAFEIEPNRPVIGCACRAAPEKGVATLLEGFDELRQSWPDGSPAPALVYFGNGSQFEELVALRERLASRADIHLAGYRVDAARLIAGATVCVVPSIWDDALPLSVMEPMALGLPVVASNAGGIGEMVLDGQTGLLVPRGDAHALAAALRRVLLDPEMATRLGDAGRARIAKNFSSEAQIGALCRIVLAEIDQAA